MNTAGLDSDNNIALLLLGRINDLVLINNTNGETSQIVLILRHKTRVLSRLAADKCAACLNAALCNS